MEYKISVPCSPHPPKITSECLQISGLGDETDKKPPP
jgi:hypothetical protein